MNSLKSFILITGFLFTINPSFSQNSATDKLKKANQDLQKIFGKKNTKNIGAEKNDSQENNTQKTPQQNDESITKTPKNNSELKPGDVHPNAVFLEVDLLCPFNQGAAVVQKGGSTAMIDAKGNFLIPFNKYELPTDYIYPLYEGSYHKHNFSGSNPLNNGMFKSGYHLINSKGEVVVTLTDASSHPFSPDGKYILNVLIPSAKGEKQTTLYNKEGKKIVIQGPVVNLSEDIGILNMSGKFHYINVITQDLITKVSYDEMNPFKDGMALVGKRNEFGEMRYGFIDRTGKEAIPLIYSIKPENFSLGLAKVFPKNQPEFKFAFINKKGDIVIKFTKDDRDPSNNIWYAGNNMFISADRIIDSTKRQYKPQEFFEQFGHKFDPKEPIGAFLNPIFDDWKIECTQRIKSPDNRGMLQAFGFFDFKTKKLVNPIFINPKSQSTPIYFDPVAKLSYAKMLIGADASGKRIFREGYINEDGIFMIVKAEGSKW